MAALTGRHVGFRCTLWQYAQDSSKTESTIETALGTATNQIIDVSDMGALTKERSIIDISVHGSDTVSKLPGQIDPGTFDFTVVLNLDNAKHKALRDDNATTQSTFVLEFSDGTNKTYAAFDGYVASASPTAPVDDVISMECSIARTGGVTWIDNA